MAIDRKRAWRDLVCESCGSQSRVFASRGKRFCDDCAAARNRASMTRSQSRYEKTAAGKATKDRYFRKPLGDAWAESVATEVEEGLR